MKWKNIININEVEFEAWSAGENYQGQAAELSKTIGTQKLAFHIEILSPKKFSCPYHFHHSEEELFLALEGKAILRKYPISRMKKTQAYFGKRDSLISVTREKCSKPVCGRRSGNIPSQSKLRSFLVCRCKPLVEHLKISVELFSQF